jgi:hypothetical protein
MTSWALSRASSFGVRDRSGGPCTMHTSQPQKGACEQNSTAPVGPFWRRLAVGPIPPAGWGTRSTRSHLGKPPEHEVPDFCSRRGGPGGAAGWARGCVPFWARSRRKGLGAKRAWVRVGSWRGSDRQHRRGLGVTEGAPPSEGKKSPRKAGRISSVERDLGAGWTEALARADSKRDRPHAV